MREPDLHIYAVEETIRITSLISRSPITANSLNFASLLQCAPKELPFSTSNIYPKVENGKKIKIKCEGPSHLIPQKQYARV